MVGNGGVFFSPVRFAVLRQRLKVASRQRQMASVLRVPTQALRERRVGFERLALTLLGEQPRLLDTGAEELKERPLLMQRQRRIAVCEPRHYIDKPILPSRMFGARFDRAHPQVTRERRVQAENIAADALHEPSAFQQRERLLGLLFAKWLLRHFGHGRQIISADMPLM